MTTPNGSGPPQGPLEKQAGDMKAATEHIRAQVKIIYDKARQAGTPIMWRQALEAIRTWQDSLEEYLVVAISMKGAVHRASLATRLTYDEEWAKVADADHSAPVHKGPEMEGPRERYAKYDLKVFNLMRAYRQTEGHLSLVEELLDEVWVRYRAVNATREDVVNILRAYAFVDNVER